MFHENGIWHYREVDTFVQEEINSAAVSRGFLLLGFSPRRPISALQY